MTGRPIGQDARDGHVYRYVRQLLGDLGELSKEGLAVTDSLPEDQTLAFIEMMELTSIYSPKGDRGLTQMMTGFEAEWRADDPTSAAELFSPIRRQAIELGLRFAFEKKGPEYLSGELFMGLLAALDENDSETFKKLIGMGQEDE